MILYYSVFDELIIVFLCNDYQSIGLWSFLNFLHQRLKRHNADTNTIYEMTKKTAI
jgi:hypothetical protein